MCDWNAGSARENHGEHTAGHTNRRAPSEEFNRDRKQAKACSVRFVKLINIISATQTVDNLDTQELQERFLNVALDYQTSHLQDASPQTTGRHAQGRGLGTELSTQTKLVSGSV